MYEKKLDEGKPGDKVRLAVRGDQKADEDTRTGSPMINNIKVTLFSPRGSF